MQEVGQPCSHGRRVPVLSTRPIHSVQWLPNTMQAQSTSCPGRAIPQRAPSPAHHTHLPAWRPKRAWPAAAAAAAGATPRVAAAAGSARRAGQAWQAAAWLLRPSWCSASHWHQWWAREPLALTPGAAAAWLPPEPAAAAAATGAGLRWQLPLPPWPRAWWGCWGLLPHAGAATASCPARLPKPPALEASHPGTAHPAGGRSPPQVRRHCCWAQRQAATAAEVASAAALAPACGLVTAPTRAPTLAAAGLAAVSSAGWAARRLAPPPRARCAATAVALRVLLLMVAMVLLLLLLAY